jgi:hypothetical protein
MDAVITGIKDLLKMVEEPHQEALNKALAMLSEGSTNIRDAFRIVHGVYDNVEGDEVSSDKFNEVLGMLDDLVA